MAELGGSSGYTSNGDQRTGHADAMVPSDVRFVLLISKWGPRAANHALRAGQARHADMCKAARACGVWSGAVQ